MRKLIDALTGARSLPTGERSLRCSSPAIAERAVCSRRKQPIACRPALIFFTSPVTIARTARYEAISSTPKGPPQRDSLSPALLATTVAPVPNENRDLCLTLAPPTWPRWKPKAFRSSAKSPRKPRVRSCSIRSAKINRCCCIWPAKLFIPPNRHFRYFI